MRYHLNAWSLYWAAWLLAFLAPELYWVYRNSAYTLSATVWAAEDLNFAHPFDFGHWTPVHWSVFALTWLLFLWLTWHMPFGLLR